LGSDLGAGFSTSFLTGLGFSGGLGFGFTTGLGFSGLGGAGSGTGAGGCTAAGAGAGWNWDSDNLTGGDSAGFSGISSCHNSHDTTANRTPACNRAETPKPVR
jgi:hypothetical protein